MTQSRIRGILACFNRGINSPINLSAFTAHIRLNVNGLQYVVFHPSRVSPLPGRMGVSILVFLELALGLGARLEDNPYVDVSILVFLELALGLACNGPARHEDGMVSILVFLELALGHHPVPISPWVKALFQSLFSWNLPSDSRLQRHRLRPECFNPCFLGTCPRTFCHTTL